MRQRFNTLPIHRKLLVISLVIVIPALLIATLCISAVDLYRTRSLMVSDTASLAGIIAENTAAAVLFQDAVDAQNVISAVRVRPTIRRACVYLADGHLFVGLSQPASLGCSPRMPGAPPWTLVASTAPIERGGRLLGSVYVERELADQLPRVLTTTLVNVAVLELLGIAALFFAGRLQRSLAQPLIDLAHAARDLDPNSPHPELPVINSGVGEVDGLSRSLADMLARLHGANQIVRLREQECEELLARERHANRMKDDFLAAVSHELRTPLNVIATWSEILMSTRVDDATLAGAIAAIHRNSRAQGRLIDDLIDVSRIATGKFSLTWSAVELRSVLADAVESVRPAGTAKGVYIETHVPPRACSVEGDRQRLQQAVSNVLENAVKFSSPGGAVSVTLRAEGKSCVISVVDSGAGIDAAFLPFVFDAFRQADASLTRRHDGLGLGLALVKQIVELHGGTVEAASDGPGHGATFTLRVPSSNPAATVREAVTSGTPSQPLEGVQILVVDDSDDTATTLAIGLRYAGGTVRAVNSGASAVQEWTTRPADVLLCDLSMPGMDGFDVLRQIQEIDAASGRTTRAISISAHATAGYVERSRAAGFAAHIGKPYQLEHVFRVVRDVLATGS